MEISELGHYGYRMWGSNHYHLRYMGHGPILHIVNEMRHLI